MTEAALTELGRYRILSELGHGAMGVVYRAEDTQLDRTVAIKTIRITTGGDDLTEYLARFRQEAKALASLNHPAIITIFDFGSENDIAYMAMELLDGVELRQRMADSRLPARLVVELASQIADGLAFAHQRGVVHRDIKPANIMVVQGERAKIMDFGIARVRVSDIKTQTGTRLGSPKYMSPEQVVGRPVDHRTDVFSLGVVLYEMLAGTAPFAGADVTQLMYQIVNTNPPPPSRFHPGQPELLDFIVAKALEKNPDDRYQSAAELAADLHACRATLAAQPASAKTAAIGEDTWPLSAGPAPGGKGVDTTWPLDKTVPLDATLPLDRTVPLDQTLPLGDRGGEHTLPLVAATAGAAQAPFQAVTTASLGASLGLLVSRHFKSTRALSRLANPTPMDRALLAPNADAPNRFRLDFDNALLLIGLLAATAAAVFIALS